MTESPVLEMRHIRKTFPGVVALDDVNFELQRGEVHILLGENGAGKSTLMKILSGAYQKSAGEIILDGVEVEIKNPKHAQTLGISTIYQEFNLIPHLSIGENIFLGREPAYFAGLINQRAVFRAATRALGALGLALNPRNLVKELRVAEQQMVEVFEIGDRVTVLRDGHSVGVYDVRGISKSELIRLMVNRELTELFPKEK